MLTSSFLPPFRAPCPDTGSRCLPGQSFAQAPADTEAAQACTAGNVAILIPIGAYQGYADQPVQSWRAKPMIVARLGLARLC